MILKNILAACTIVGLAIASPAENIQARADTCGKSSNAYCCASAYPSLDIFFIQGAGSHCVAGKASPVDIREDMTNIMISHAKRI